MQNYIQVFLVCDREGGSAGKSWDFLLKYNRMTTKYLVLDSAIMLCKTVFLWNIKIGEKHMVGGIEVLSQMVNYLLF
jgi:hypothetical protein